MINEKLESAIEGVQDFWYNSNIAPVLVCLGFYGTFAANGFYRGFNNMPVAPEHLNQVLVGEKAAVGIAGILEASLLVDGLKSERYSDGFRTVACLIGMPILGALTHAAGYAVGSALNKL